MTSNVTFTDHAHESMLDYSTRIPHEGEFKAAENMKRHFEGSQTNGAWVLSIYDRDIDNMSGTLLGWKLHMNVHYCSEGVQWTKLSNNSNSCEETIITDGKAENRICKNDCKRHTDLKEVFYPRYGHTSVAIGNDMFIIGGNSHQVMTEIWRFNYEMRYWIQLHSSLKRPNFYGQVACLTPYGMIAVGGIRNTLHGTSMINNILLYDVMNETEIDLNISFE